MDQNFLLRTETSSDTQGAKSQTILERMISQISTILVPMFTLFFLLFALFYIGNAAVEFFRPILDSGDLNEGLVKGLHMGVVAMAVYELAKIIYQEYDPAGTNDSVIPRMRRGIIRFVSVVCTALVLESLILVIKYSQKDLAGFLYYPVAIIAAAAALLMALGVFTKLTQSEVEVVRD